MQLLQPAVSAHHASERCRVRDLGPKRVDAGSPVGRHDTAWNYLSRRGDSRELSGGDAPARGVPGSRRTSDVSLPRTLRRDGGRVFALPVDFGRAAASYGRRRRASTWIGGESAVKYFVLLAGYGEMAPWEQLSVEEQNEQMAKLGAFDEACGASAAVAILSAEALSDGSVATTLRTRAGQMTVTDGPFAEAAEHIGGFYLIDAPDLDTVIELCKVLPAYDIEIRPVPDMS